MPISTDQNTQDWCETAAYEAALAAPLCERLRAALEAGEGKALVDAAFAMSWVFANHVRQNRAEDARVKGLSDEAFEAEFFAAQCEEPEATSGGLVQALIERLKGG